jgi:hypothetical protein
MWQGSPPKLADQFECAVASSEVIGMPPDQIGLWDSCAAGFGWFDDCLRASAPMMAMAGSDGLDRGLNLIKLEIEPNWRPLRPKSDRR